MLHQMMRLRKPTRHAPSTVAADRRNMQRCGGDMPATNIMVISSRQIEMRLQQQLLER